MWFDLNPHRFGFVQEKFDVIGDSVSMAALEDLIHATEKNIEDVARDWMYAYLMEGGDPEVLLEDLRKFQEGQEK